VTHCLPGCETLCRGFPHLSLSLSLSLFTSTAFLYLTLDGLKVPEANRGGRCRRLWTLLPSAEYRRDCDWNKVAG
ncbi:hypothetical protein DPEC_G00343910, partial [Dallia pectoralis]